MQADGAHAIPSVTVMPRVIVTHVTRFFDRMFALSFSLLLLPGRLPLAQQRGYSNVFSALFRIGKEEGAAAYMAGVGPTVARAMIVNMLQVR